MKPVSKVTESHRKTPRKEGRVQEEGRKSDAPSALIAFKPVDLIIAEVVDPFDTFWDVFPKRQGANPKETAKKSWDKRVSNGAKPDEIIAGARHYAIVVRNVQDRTMICAAVVYLNQGRWKDEDIPIAAVRRQETQEDTLQRLYAERFGDDNVVDREAA
jgi:hypothetical protein